MSIFVPLPLPGASIDMKILKELRNVRGAMPSDVLAFHAIDGFAAESGGLLYVPNSGSQPKRWSDTGKPGVYLTIDGVLDAWLTATWSDFSMQVYGRTISQFYQDYAHAKSEDLRWIPRFVETTAALPKEMNMWADLGRTAGPRVVTADEVPYPLGKQAPETVTGWTWPTEHAIRRNPQTGVFETFRYQDYLREFPIKTTVSVGGSTGSGKAQVKAGQAGAFLGAAAQALFTGQNPDAAAAKVIADFVEVK
jgi:hypothetical protein